MTIRNDGTAIVLVLHGDLGLGVGSQPRAGTVATSIRHGLVQFVGEKVRQGVELGGLVGGISEHETLVTSTELLESLLVVETLGNVGGLLLNADQNTAGLVVEALVGRVVADVFDGITDNLLVVDRGLGGDLTKDHDHAGLGGGLASDLGEGVLL
ncbi:hypothetical protein RRF57_009581 [Xylaria bambusicola]|uniref:Uncharacterized protein n=1 Tax=Xylaria bambusicola TaxID=326684 RepID=A0AAN7UQF7_9PEZI